MLKLFVALLAISAVSTIDPWKINPDFSIRFSDRYADGYFSDLSGTLIFDSANLPGASFQVKVQTASINTGNKLKNKHAKSEHWFDAEKFQFISFSSDSVFKADQYYVRGKLTIKDITQQIIIPFQFTSQGDSAVFEGACRINRAAFGLGKQSNNSSDSATIWLRVPVSPMK